MTPDAEIVKIRVQTQRLRGQYRARVSSPKTWEIIFKALNPDAMFIKSSIWFHKAQES